MDGVRNTYELLRAYVRGVAKQAIASFDALKPTETGPQVAVKQGLLGGFKP